MHLHYSPYQFATDTQAANCEVDAHKVVKTLDALTRKDTAKVRNMGSTMTVAEAAAIPLTPTAFISPNPVDVMRDIKKPMAATGVKSVSNAKPYDPTYRNRMREGYGDRSY